MVTEEQGNLIHEFHETFPEVITVEDTMRLILRLKLDRDYWAERCQRAEECIEFLHSKKRWWQR